MVKFITKTACMALITTLCAGSLNAQFRGEDSNTYFTVSDGTVYKGTVANPSGEPIGSTGSFVQCAEYIDGVIYAVDYSMGSNRFGTINMEDGSWTTIKADFATDGVSLCYNPVDGKVYVTPWTGDFEDGIFGTVDLSTGDVTPIATLPSGDDNTYFMAIDNDGVAYAAISESDKFGTVDLSSGVFTQTATLPFSTAFIQNMSVDRETNEIYWLARNFIDWNSIYYKVGKDGTVTLITAIVEEALSFCIISEIGSPDPCPVVTDLAADVQGSDVKLTWTAAEGDPTGYKIYDGTNELDFVTATEYLVKNLSDGEHTLAVEAVYDDDCTPEQVTVTVNIESIPPPCNPVTALELDLAIDACIAILTWTAAADMPDAKYNVYRDDEQIANDFEGTEYEDIGFEDGIHTWTVKTICEEGEAEGVDVTGICGVGINELANNVSIYPNPVSGMVTIKVEGFAKVEVYNTVGQLVETRTIPTFDVSSYNTGIYLFKVYDVYNNSVTKRVMVK